MLERLQGLYAITDEYLTPDESVVEQVKEAIEAGVDIIQYRNKHKSDAEVRDICIALQALCREYGVLFIIDDRVHLAQEIRADGIHIGKDDISVCEAREIFPKGIIGVSCYGALSKAEEALKEGADYVAFGSFFPSPTKPQSGIVSASVIAKARDSLVAPICVIGGITQNNIEEILKEKPDMVSVVSAVFDGDITSNVKKLLKAMGR